MINRKAMQKKKLLGKPYEIYINTVFEDYVSSENIDILLSYYVVNDNEGPSTSSQIVEQIEVIKEVVLPTTSKLND